MKPRKARIPVKQFTSWSYSRYNVYKTCPFKAKLKFLDKIEEPKGEAMLRGIEIHEKAEKYIKSEIPRIPKELSQFKEEFRYLRKQYKKVISGMSVEESWAFTKDWDETAWKDWTRAWVRIKVDCAHHLDETTLVIDDWKTGKFRPEHNEDYIEQLELYGLAALLMLPHIEVVIPRLKYLDHGVTYPRPGIDEELMYHREDLPKLIKEWGKRVKPMMMDKRFEPRHNNTCRWCFYRKSNKPNGGGQCKF